MSGNEAWNRNVFKRRQKVDRDGADIVLSGRLFQMVGPATGKARPPTVDSFTDGTRLPADDSRLVRAQRNEAGTSRSLLLPCASNGAQGQAVGMRGDMVASDRHLERQI